MHIFTENMNFFTNRYIHIPRFLILLEQLKAYVDNNAFKTPTNS